MPLMCRIQIQQNQPIGGGVGGSKDQRCLECPKTHFGLDFLKSEEIFEIEKKAKQTYRTGREKIIRFIFKGGETKNEHRSGTWFFPATASVSLVFLTVSFTSFIYASRGSSSSSSLPSLLPLGAGSSSSSSSSSRDHFLDGGNTVNWTISWFFFLSARHCSIRSRLFCISSSKRFCSASCKWFNGVIVYVRICTGMICASIANHNEIKLI